MIICGAIYMETPKGTLLIPCYRHGRGRAHLEFLNKELFDEARKAGKLVEGFIDNKNVFYDRAEAFKHAKKCGQLSASTMQLKKERGEKELYTEDLY